MKVFTRAPETSVCRTLHRRPSIYIASPWEPLVRGGSRLACNSRLSPRPSGRACTPCRRGVSVSAGHVSRSQLGRCAVVYVVLSPSSGRARIVRANGSGPVPRAVSSRNFRLVIRVCSIVRPTVFLPPIRVYLSFFFLLGIKASLLGY